MKNPKIFDETFKKNSIKLLKLLAVFLSAVYVAVFVWTAASRIDYKFDLEWMEGGQIEHSARILEGERIYVEPSIEFAPYIYTPLYAYLGAGAMVLSGENHIGTRALSIFATLACIVLIYLIVKKVTASVFAGIIAAGFFAATYKLSGFWFDLARVDSVFIAFFLVSVMFLVKERTPKNLILSAVFAFLSYFTKQSALFVVAPIMIYLFFEDKKLNWYFNLTFVGLFLASTAIYSALTDGWFFYWNYLLPADHHWNYKYFYAFWTSDLIKKVPVAVAALAAFSVVFLKDMKNRKIAALFAFAVGAIACAWLSRLHYGGWLNVLIPAHAALALVFGIAFNKMLRLSEKTDGAFYLKFFALSLIIFQLVGMNYDPKDALPTKTNRAAAEKFIDYLSGFEGEVYVPAHPFIARLASKKTYIHEMLVYDLLISDSPHKENFNEKFNSALENGYFEAIILNETSKLTEIVERYYRRTDRVFDPDTILKSPVAQTGPTWIYLPKDSSQKFE